LMSELKLRPPKKIGAESEGAQDGPRLLLSQKRKSRSLRRGLRKSAPCGSGGQAARRACCRS